MPIFLVYLFGRCRLSRSSYMQSREVYGIQARKQAKRHQVRLIIGWIVFMIVLSLSIIFLPYMVDTPFAWGGKITVTQDVEKTVDNINEYMILHPDGAASALESRRLLETGTNTIATEGTYPNYKLIGESPDSPGWYYVYENATQQYYSIDNTRCEPRPWWDNIIKCEDLPTLR